MDTEPPGGDHPFRRVPFAPSVGPRLIANYFFLTLDTRLRESLLLVHDPAQFYSFNIDVGDLDYVLPLDWPAADNYVVIIHDSSHLYTEDDGMRVQDEKIAARSDSVDRVITVSEHSNRDIVLELGFSEEDVAVVYNCVDVDVFDPEPRPDDVDTLDTYGITEP